MQGAALKTARDVLARQAAKDSVGQFNVPVDTAYLHDYLDVVTTPMDLGTVRGKLNAYADVESFARDVRLVYENSIAYCRSRHPQIFKLAQSLLKAFQKECEGALKPFLGAEKAAPQGRRLVIPGGKSKRADGSAAPKKAVPKLAMSDAVAEAVRKCVDAAKRSRGAQPFRAAVDLSLWRDYKDKVGAPMDLPRLDAKFRNAAYKKDVNGWMTDARRIAANCLRYNTDVRHPELREAATLYLTAVDKAVETTLRPACVDDLAASQNREAAVVLVDAALPKLLPQWADLLKCIESAVLNLYDGGSQQSYAFLHPIASYYASPSESTLLTYLEQIKKPICVGDVVARLLGASETEQPYSDVSEVDADMKLVFANARQFYGTRGDGRKLHGDADADAYCALALKFADQWEAALLRVGTAARPPRPPAPPKQVAAPKAAAMKTVKEKTVKEPAAVKELKSAKEPKAAVKAALKKGAFEPALKKGALERAPSSNGRRSPTRADDAAPRPPSASGKKVRASSPPPPSALEGPPFGPPAAAGASPALTTARRALQAVRDHRMNDGYETATAFLGALPSAANYAAAIGGIEKARDLIAMGEKLELGGYATMGDLSDDVQLCFANARKWKKRVDELSRGPGGSKFTTPALEAAETLKAAAMLEAMFEDAVEDVDASESLAKPQTKLGGKEPRLAGKEPRSQAEAALPVKAKRSSPEAAAAVKAQRGAPSSPPLKKKRAASPVEEEEDDTFFDQGARFGSSAFSARPLPAPSRGPVPAKPAKPRGREAAEPPPGFAKFSAAAAVSARPLPPAPKAQVPRHASPKPAVVDISWRPRAEKLYHKVARHEWVRVETLPGSEIRWFHPAIESFPCLGAAYLALIPRPADLGGVKMKLDAGGYSEAPAFVAELKLVFENALAFNQAAFQEAQKGVGEADDIAVRIYDIAAHLLDWIDHLACEFFIFEEDKYKLQVSTEDQKVYLAGEAGSMAKPVKGEAKGDEDKPGGDKPGGDKPGGRTGKNLNLNLATAATQPKGGKSLTKPKALEPEVKPTAAEREAATKAALAIAPVLTTKTGELTRERRAELRFSRDVSTWRSRLEPNAKALAEARAVLRQLRKQQFKKFTHYFEVKVVGVPDYSASVAQPTCLELIARKLGEVKTKLPTDATPDFEDDDGEVQPFETLGDFAQECRRIFSNALAYNARFRHGPANSVSNLVCAAVEVLSPILEDALFALALDAYERVGRERISIKWDRKKMELHNEETAVRSAFQQDLRKEAKRKIDDVLARDRTSTRDKREKTLRLLSRACVANLDVLAVVTVKDDVTVKDADFSKEEGLEDPSAAQPSTPPPSEDGDRRKPPPTPKAQRSARADVFEQTAEDRSRSRKRRAALLVRRAIAETVRLQPAAALSREGNDDAAGDDGMDVDDLQPTAPDAPRLSGDASLLSTTLRHDRRRVAFALKAEPRRRRAAWAPRVSVGFCDDEYDAGPHPPRAVVSPMAAESSQDEEEVFDASRGDTGWLDLDDETQLRILVSCADLKDRDLVAVAIVLRGPAALGHKELLRRRPLLRLVAQEREADAHFFRAAIGGLRLDERRRRALASVSGAPRRAQAPAPATRFTSELLERGFEATRAGCLATEAQRTRRGGRPHVEQRLVASPGAMLFLGSRRVHHPLLGGALAAK